MVCTTRLKRMFMISLSSSANRMGVKKAMPMRSTTLMNTVLRSTRRKSGAVNSRSKYVHPAHGLPNNPPETVNFFQASTRPAIGT